MNITAIAPWYGAKRSIADVIIRHIGEHSSYWEPFCGSMAVLLAKPAVRHEAVNDLHGDLLNLARVIADPLLAPRLDWELRRTLVHERVYRDAVAELRAKDCNPDHPPSVPRARTFFVASWLALNGIAGTRQRSTFAKRFTSNGGCPAVRFVSAVESIPDWHERLREVAIYHGCGIELCEKIEDKVGTVIYCDPPYLSKTTAYVHDFESEHHTRLAAALNRYKLTRCVVSYYEHPELARLYPKWIKVRVKASRKLTTATASPSREDAPEVLLISQPVLS